MTDFDDDLRTAVATVASRTVAPPFELVGYRARARRTRHLAAGAIGAVAIVTSVAIAIPSLRTTKSIAPASGGTGNNSSTYCGGAPGAEVAHGTDAGHTWSWTVHAKGNLTCEDILVDGAKVAINPAEGGPVPRQLPLDTTLFTSGTTRWVLVRAAATSNVATVFLSVNGHTKEVYPLPIADRTYFGAVFPVTGNPVLTIGGSGYDREGNQVLDL